MKPRGIVAALAMFFASASFAEVPPPPGTPAPDFSLLDANGKLHRLADWRGKWLVLYFYPKDDTSGCTAEAMAFRDRQKQLTDLKAEVVGVSLDDGASHQAFAERYKLPYTLLTDRDGVVARRYGALSDYRVIRFAKRYSFLIDPDGRVAKSYLKVDADRHADEVIADLKALR